ncbi:TRAP transporter small permease [Aeribacillus pallidus]|uniref:Tripartite ATP-independent periplasmic transporters DctQ component domain-containing protein n=1 Tax=Aeribacillus pallidus TaxID=33936 RepID=A0A223E2H0_9BACI|nr:TRAP transporter small permease [Aeribacillus pallidus]ASS89454.1 hypothetical protein AP3564_03605 [Aeribacillus pallidus]
MDKNNNSLINSFFRIINRVTDVMAAISAAAIFVVVVWQVIARLLGVPSPWTEEVTRYLFIWLIFLGIGVGFRKAESARVTILIKYAPKILNKTFTVIYAVATIGFFGFMLVYGIELMSQQINTNETSAALLLPMWVIGLSVPFSAVVGILNVIQSLIYNRELIEEG